MKYAIVLKPKIGRVLKRTAVGLAWLVLGGGLVGAVFGFSFFMAMRLELRSTQVTVPDLSGLDLVAAGDDVQELQLVLDVVDERHDPRVASGKIIEQMPHPGASVRRGRKIKLVLSLGGKVLMVPDLVGHAARAVAIELGQEGFAAGDEARVHSYDMGAGKVLAQVPPSDSRAVPKSRVHRLVSDGPPRPTWVMPDLTGLPRRRAERWLEDAGFRRGAVRRVSTSGMPEGTVVGQLPLAGYPIRSKDIVDLAVAE